MEEEKKDINKDEVKAIQKKQSRIVLIIFAIVIAIILIISGVVGIVSNINEKKKEVQNSSQLENENLQEEKKEENTIPDYIELSDTSFTGATFKKKWSEFKKETDNYYNEKYKDSVAIVKENSLTTKYNSNNVEYAIFKYYKYSTSSISPKLVAGYCVQVDTTTDNIIGIYYTFFSDKVNIDEYAFDFPVFLDLILKDTLKENLSTYLEHYLNKTTQEKSNWNYYKDNVIFYTIQNNNQISISVCATGGKETEYFQESGQWRILQTTNTETQNSNNTNSTVVADIQDRIEFFNSYYAWNFHPTDEQMKQMVEFANTTSNLTNDTLADFIIDKGWLPDSETGTGNNNSSSTTSNKNNNSSSSNKNTSSNSNTNQTKKPQPVLNVTVDPYSYLSKEEQNGETKKFNIVIKFNGKVVKSDTITSNGDDYTPPTYENIKVDSESGTLTVEVNGKTIKYTDGSTSVAVSMYLSYDEWQNNSFNFYDITKMMG